MVLGSIIAWVRVYLKPSFLEVYIGKSVGVLTVDVQWFFHTVLVQTIHLVNLNTPTVITLC